MVFRCQGVAQVDSTCYEATTWRFAIQLNSDTVYPRAKEKEQNTEDLTLFFPFCKEKKAHTLPVIKISRF
jgi:hypothetical protein